MGRRPNVVLLEYFERGEKLGDTSNRYHHSCKKCGQDFPKGRVDTLVAHLLKKCQGVTQRDREWVSSQVADRKSKGSQRPNETHFAGQGDSPFQLYQEQSALDTLAEVSRRHLDYSTQTVAYEAPQSLSAPTEGQPLSDEAVRAHLKEFVGLTSTPDHGERPLTSSAGPVDDQHHQLLPPADAPAFIANTTFLASPALVQTASAASQQLEAVRSPSIQLESDTTLVPGYRQAEASGHPQHASHSTDDFDTQALQHNSQRSNGLRHIESNEFAPSLAASVNIITRTNQQKRSHFSINRRKEVADIRKQGACLRCRMLKKPCSGGTPCVSCSKLDTARIWKDACTRDRLADTFGLYSTHLFHTKAITDVSAARSGCHTSSPGGRVEVRFFTHVELCMTFKTEAFTHEGGATLDLHTELNTPDAKNTFTLLHTDALSLHLGSYVRSLSTSFVEAEPSPFVQRTLQLAQQLSAGEEFEVKPELDDPKKVGPNRRQLLDNTIDLWILTTMLARPEAYPAYVQYRKNSVAQPRPIRLEQTSTAPAGKIHNIPRDSLSHRLISIQLRAGMESRCAQLSRDVVSELERRLLQRGSTSQLATFIAAVILLNCVERMTGLYLSVDDSQAIQGAEVSHHLNDPTFEAETSATTPSTGLQTHRQLAWPLDLRPSTLWHQGPHFASAVTTFLRLRNLPPKTGSDDEGNLMVIKDNFMVQGQSHNAEYASRVEKASAWLDPLKMSVNALLAKRDGPLPTKEDGVEAWELRFVAGVLLSDKAIG